MEEALAWFARLRSPSLAEDERRSFAAWRERDPAHAAAYARVEALWDAPELTAALMRHGGADARDRRRPRWAARRGARAIAALAAVLLLAVGLGAVVDLPTRLQADQRTATGEQRRITLADGSAMVLNTASAMAIDFTGDRRGVRLLGGEAFFDVAANDRRPFEVAAGDATVRVTGTAFAVRRTDRGVTVTVARGSVSVAAEGSDAPAARLGPGDQVRVRDGRIEVRGQVDVEMALAWHDGRLIFRDQPLGRVLDEIARYHTGWIVVAEDRVKHLRVSGNYRLDDPVRIVESLADASGARMFRVSDALILLR